MKPNRILLKLSGESLMGEKQYGIDAARLDDYVQEIAAVAQSGVEIAIVIGGGNIFRGLKAASQGMDRVTGDSMGMLATIINSLALESALKEAGVPAMLLSGMPIPGVCEPMSGKSAIELLAAKKVVIIAGGTGNPYFTTDTASALRALEVKADVILKGTRVDGVYTADPEKDKNAVKYDTISFKEAYDKGLEIMDLTAFTLCRENNMPIIVFDMNKKGNLMRVCKGEKTGTLIQV
jgi:uridylate kinase